MTFRIENAFATEALYSFIDKRSKSEEYRKHLGIISTVRTDFEILNSLFMEHNEEARIIKNAKEFREKFKRPLERIVLYIDDLDRCPEENVVQVLEAVNLLMAFPLFVVVVGVDARWIKNALLKKHSIQFATPSLSADADREILEPSSYLEKIFQVAFHLKDAGKDVVKQTIRSLASNGTDIHSPEPSQTIFTESIGSGDATEKTSDGASTSQIFSDHRRVVNSSMTQPIVPKTLVLTDLEIGYMAEMSEIIGSNPRAIKRFVNTYQIIKAHDEFEYDLNNNKELVGILFLLALPLGMYRPLVKSLEAFVDSQKSSETLLNAYLQPTNDDPKLDGLKRDLGVVITNVSSSQLLQKVSVSMLRRHNAFIRRFTFRDL